jgi:bifunctional non-homologous end joining protein LigD
MLATSSRYVPEGDGWAFEPKLDGWRCLIEIDEGLTVRTRHGRDITAAVPELASLGEVVGRPAVLDGELVAGAGRLFDFYRLRPRVGSRPQRSAVAFAAFDLLALDGEPLIGLPYRERRARLEEVMTDGPAWCVVRSFTGDIADVLTACIELGLEGAMAKRVDSPYRPGERSPHWRKLKTVAWRTEHAEFRHER